MIIHDFNVFGVATRPAEADTELIVHANAPLTSPPALQLFEPVSRRRAHIIDPLGKSELFEFAQRRTLDVHEARHPMQPE